VSSLLPDGIGGADLCHIEGCVGKGRCPRCGSTDYGLMGYFGAVASAAKRWGVSEAEAERRIEAHQRESSDK
jgi:hypothetical protein